MKRLMFRIELLFYLGFAAQVLRSVHQRSSVKKTRLPLLFYFRFTGEVLLLGSNDLSY